MKEKVLKKIMPYGYKVIEHDDTVLIKSYFGNLKISYNNKSYSITKKFNFSNYSLLAFLIFFFIVVYEGRHDIDVIIYVIISLAIIMQIFYNSIMLEIRKNKLHSVLDEIFNSYE